MPLPLNGSAWPPPAHSKTAARMRNYDAWYAGDADRLVKVYGSAAAKVPANHPAQYRGGFVGAVARMFWGAPTPVGEKRNKLHVPLPADIATASADMLFAKPPAITFADPGTAGRWEKLDDLLKLRTRLHEAAEVASPLGGVYLRAGWDDTVAGHPLLSAVHGDCGFPEFRWNRLAAVTFVRILDGAPSGKVWRHLERHEMVRNLDGKGTHAVTLHGLYLGTVDNLGQAHDLGRHDETRDLLPVVDRGLPVLPVAYVPNMLPNRLDRGSDIGRSDYEGPIVGLFDAADETLSSWMRDVRLAKARIMVPGQYLTSLGPGQGAAFDTDREAYESLNIPPTSTNAGITLQQFAIRVEEHSRTLRELRLMAVEAAGYSASTFGLDTATAAKTATEVTDRANRTLLTRDKKTAYWGEGVAHIASALLWIDRLVFNTPGIDPAEAPAVEWPPGASVDALKLAQTAQTLAAAEAVSTETKVRMVHPDWNDTRVGQEVMRILAEQGAANTDPMQVLSEAAATGVLKAMATAATTPPEGDQQQ